MNKSNQVTYDTRLLPVRNNNEYMAMFEAIRTDQADILQEIINRIPENQRHEVINGKFDFIPAEVEKKRISTVFALKRMILFEHTHYNHEIMLIITTSTKFCQEVDGK